MRHTVRRMEFSDSLILDAPRRTSAGYLVARARAATTGVYQYAGYEVDPTNAHGLRDKQIVNVLRDENTVFDKAAVQSFIGKPVTDDHPSQPVTAANWRDHARGTIMGAMRDGEYLAFDLMLTDAGAIAKVDAGKRELSNGYSANLEFGQFTAPDGTVCDARQSKITGGNHVAIVDRGRAGSACRISDSKPFAACDANPAILADLNKGNVMKKIVLDGLQVDLSDADAVAAAVTKLQDQAKASADEADEYKKKMAAKDGEIAALTKQLADAKAAAEPAAIDKLVADRAALVSTVKALDSAIVTDGKTDAQIRRELVEAKLGDVGKALDDAAIPGAFAVLAKDAEKAEAKDAIVQLQKPANALADREMKAFADSVANLNAWRTRQGNPA
ncbi:DUF2213 domain-containing protein [Blastomonas sp. CCH1-A6]|uniref:DUF2213 domain-containing protein n=1 Tax=Blastomonas sp. CCH1-A6 TaxID=1768762 RepID=UPI001E507692